ncbi:tyrosine-type recombinase/integrase [Microvirga sp. RSM25]|uniref:tyrosine-type recombinase/integrase n=1 Tax=Microvirga sp. RSM25 TaxID=3273802 RepID=UPI00384FE6D5
MYLVKRHRKWYAIHDIPPKLKPVMGFGRFSRCLETEDEKAAKRRADMLWLHDWSKQIEEAKRGAPHKEESDAAFYRSLLATAGTEEERKLILGQIEDEARDRYHRALEKAGYIDEREIPPDEVPPGWEESQCFLSLATGKLVPTLEHLNEWLQALNNEAKTKDMKKSTVIRFAEAFPYLQDVNRKDVQRWLNKRVTEEGLTTKTLNRYLSELRSYWTFLRSLELVPEEGSPFEKLTLNGKRFEARRDFSPADVVTLLRAAEAKNDKHLSDVITLAMWTGARIESLCKLKVEDVKKDHVRIEDDKTEAGTRDVPIHSKLKPTLKRLLEESKDGFVLSGLSANKYGDRSDAVGKRFGRLKTDLGFGDAHVFHSIRKTVTTILENAGVPENVAADVVGHEKPRITYGLYSGGNSLEVKRKAIEKLSYPF